MKLTKAHIRWLFPSPYKTPLYSKAKAYDIHGAVRAVVENRPVKGTRKRRWVQLP